MPWALIALLNYFITILFIYFVAKLCLQILWGRYAGS